MEVSTIVVAALLLGGLGLVFGGVLAIVSKVFSVPADPVFDAVREALPGANCGGCGFSGCDAYARAVAEGKAGVSQCPVGGAEVAGRIAAVMGVDAEKMERKAAVVMCRGGQEKCRIRFSYDGPRSCRSAALAGDGDKACRYSCLGWGDCERACPFGAIHVNEERLAVVHENACRGCGVCVDVCPRGVLRLMPVEHAVHRMCSAMERGKVVRENCSAGCLGCGKCERSCKFGALKLVSQLPEIDLEKCVGCMCCADNCPTGALQANEALRRHALIRYGDCTGCGACAAACQFGAIVGGAGQPHSVVEWNCVGCGACAAACPQDCVQMVYNTKSI